MKNKHIVFTTDRTAELQECTVREPADHEVLVKMKYTAISNGTEKANLGESRQNVGTLPCVLGYSGSGVVTAAGKGVTRFQVGDRVAGTWGNHASYMTYPETNLTKIPDSVSFDVAALAQISTFPMTAIRKTNVSLGESAIVMGLGILGIFAVQLLKAAGAVPVIAVDPTEKRRLLALELGADYAFDPTEPDFAAKVKACTDGGANAAIEVTGLGKGLDQVLDCMAKFGRVALLGCTRNFDFNIDYYRKVHVPGITLIGAHTNARPSVESRTECWTHEDDKKAYFRLITGGRIHPDKLISEIHTPEEAYEVYERLKHDPDFPFGVLFRWEEAGDTEG